MCRATQTSNTMLGRLAEGIQTYAEDEMHYRPVFGHGPPVKYSGTATRTNLYWDNC